MIDKDLYNKIIQVMPIPCVDIIIGDRLNNILLIKRMNEPAIGQWWFPGGRILFKEKRTEAVERIVFKECGIAASPKTEMGTYDLFLPIAGGTSISHAVTTLYYVQVESLHTLAIRLDDQSGFFQIHKMNMWSKKNLHHFIKMSLDKLKDLII